MYFYLISATILIFVTIVAIVIFSRGPNISTKHDIHKPRFVDHKTMSTIVNNSIYFQRMTPTDLIPRNASSPQAYAKLYKASIIPFTDQQTRTLTQSIHELQTTYLRPFSNLNRIPWKFARVTEDIESGYPHTLHDVIILSDKFFTLSTKDQQKTLVHEKVHVYQRVHPLQTYKLIHDVWGFQVKDKIVNFPLSRNNPDVNNFVYGKKQGRIIQLYTNQRPQTLADSQPFLIDDKGNSIALTSLNQLDIETLPYQPYIQLEHPYEIMACLLAELIMSSDISYLTNVQEWMKTNL